MKEVTSTSYLRLHFVCDELQGFSEPEADVAHMWDFVKSNCVRKNWTNLFCNADKVFAFYKTFLLLNGDTVS